MRLFQVWPMLQCLLPGVRPQRLLDLQLCQATLALHARFAPPPASAFAPAAAPPSLPDPSERTHLSAMWHLMLEHGVGAVPPSLAGSTVAQQALTNPRYAHPAPLNPEAW